MGQLFAGVYYPTKGKQMPRRPENTPDRRRRLGGWLPRKEAELIVFRKDLASKARERKGMAPRASAVQELAQLIDGDPVLLDVAVVDTGQT